MDGGWKDEEQGWSDGEADSTSIHVQRQSSAQPKQESQSFGHCR